MQTKDYELPFYVTTVGGYLQQEKPNRGGASSLVDYQWMYCIAGKGLLILNGIQYDLPENTGCLLYPNTPHLYYPVKKPWTTRWVTFSGYGVRKLLQDNGFNNSNVYNIHNIQGMNLLTDDIFTTAQSKNVLKNYESSILLYDMLVRLKFHTYSYSERINAQANEKLQPVMNYIEENFEKDISLPEIAGVIDVSPQYLCRIFSKRFNMSPATYLIKYRVHMAKTFLTRDSSVRVSDIASQVGFHDLSYFCKTFRKLEGISPTEFRTSLTG